MLRRRTVRQSTLWLDNGSQYDAEPPSLGSHSSSPADGHAQKAMPRPQVDILPGPRHALNAASPGRRRRRTAAILAICMFALWLLSSRSTTQSGHTLSDDSDLPIVTLASSAARLHSNELAITLRSLFLQTMKPKEIRLYLTDEDKEVFEWHQKHVESRLSRFLNDGQIRLFYVKDVGPSTKFVYAIRDMLEQDRANQAIIVLDDDHSYSPDLVATFMKYSRSPPFADTAVGLRGWRLRSDFHWGVPEEELDDHVANGWKLTEPFRVSVLTANEGYLVRPRFFLKGLHMDMRDTALAHRAPLLNLEQLNASAAHLVDDIWLNGHLSEQRVERYVVPLNSHGTSSSVWESIFAGAAIPSIDVTKAHTLEGRIQREGFTRTTANWVALQLFKDAWRKENLFYHTRGERRQMTAQEALSCIPRYHAGIGALWTQLLKLYHHLYVRMIFGQ